MATWATWWPQGPRATLAGSAAAGSVRRPPRLEHAPPERLDRRRQAAATGQLAGNGAPERRQPAGGPEHGAAHQARRRPLVGDRKSTSLNSSHVATSDAVFSLQKT